MLRKILLIVEGDNDEVSFLTKLFNNCYKKAEFKFYSYRANIHMLSQELYNNYRDFDIDEIDIKLVLSSLETDKNKINLLKDNYNDIFIIFDFEPHHDIPHFYTVQKMIKYFNDSTYQGKLYINYPMMQSYKHFDKLPCPDFENLIVKLEQCKCYKKLVGDFSNYTDLNKYTYLTYYNLSVHHLKKANKILNNIYDLPTYDEYLNFDFVKIYDNQIKLLKTKQSINVLNTCIFILIDYAPKKYFRFISTNDSII